MLTISFSIMVDSIIKVLRITERIILESMPLRRLRHSPQICPDLPERMPPTYPATAQNRFIIRIDKYASQQSLLFCSDPLHPPYPKLSVPAQRNFINAWGLSTIRFISNAMIAIRDQTLPHDPPTPRISPPFFKGLETFPTLIARGLEDRVTPEPFTDLLI